MDLCIDKVEMTFPVPRLSNQMSSQKECDIVSAIEAHESISEISKQWQKRVQAIQNFSVF